MAAKAKAAAAEAKASAKKAKAAAAAKAKVSLDKPRGSDSLPGWTVDSTLNGGIVDSISNPFELQRQQLLIYIEQARKEGMFDELATLEASLLDIETMMLKGTYL